MNSREIAAVVGGAAILVGLAALALLAGRVTYGGFGPVALLGLALPVALAVGFALLVLFRW
ncbi:hypothetical protein [Halobellus rufus]|uniref:hypothetical protein n=1 Tax=Halobellus rufus TaxID=1448860 RepID=UPI00067919A3|nr:hypothetical protein [Halobellus rufus]